MNKFPFLFLMYFAINLCSFATESDYLPYVIRTGDNVSEVIARYKLAPLYGRNEWLKKVLKLNRLTEESAKKVKVGDVIVIPLKSIVFKQAEYEDQVSLMKSALEKATVSKTVEKIKEDYFVEKNYAFKAGAEYFNQLINIANETINIAQNFTGYIEYQERNMGKLSGFSFEPLVRMGFYTQSQADFERNQFLSADFTPSYFMTGKLEFRIANFDLSLAPVLEYERFSALRLLEDEYQVLENDLVWSGLELSKYFRTKKNTYYLSSQYSQGDRMGATRYDNRVGVLYQKHYQFELRAAFKTLNLGETATIQSYGFNFAYQY